MATAATPLRGGAAAGDVPLAAPSWYSAALARSLASRYMRASLVYVLYASIMCAGRRARARARAPSARRAAHPAPPAACT